MTFYEMLKLSVWKTEDLTRCMEIRRRGRCATTQYLKVYRLNVVQRTNRTGLFGRECSFDL